MVGEICTGLIGVAFIVLVIAANWPAGVPKFCTVCGERLRCTEELAAYDREDGDRIVNKFMTCPLSDPRHPKYFAGVDYQPRIDASNTNEEKHGKTD